MFIEESENEIVERVENKVSSIINIPIEHGEDHLIFQYTTSQQYKAHHDFFKVANNNKISPLVMCLYDEKTVKKLISLN